MNWYKKLKLSQKYRHPQTYMDIGHYDDPQSNCDEWLWAFIDGQLHVEEALPGAIHEQYWSHEDLNKSFSGRYDDCRKQISIGTPSDYPKNRGIPTAIVRLVERAFPNAIGTYAFLPGSPAIAV